MTEFTPFAAPAPTAEAEEADTLPAEDGKLHELFEQWSAWSRTRRYYAPPPTTGTILGKLSSKTRPLSAGAPDASCSASMAALHLAIIGQPREALDTKVFMAFYGHRAAIIKTAAASLGISRSHFYRLLHGFCTRVHAAARQIEADNVAAAQALPHRSDHAPLAALD